MEHTATEDTPIPFTVGDSNRIRENTVTIRFMLRAGAFIGSAVVTILAATLAVIVMRG